MAKTIDLTPTWEQILPTLLVIHADAETAKARETARTELRRMARLADLYVASQQAKAVQHG